jgi:hypothetical protein
MALTVTSARKHTTSAGTAVSVRITAADDQSGTTVSIGVEHIPEGVAYQLTDVRARDDAGSATAWQPQVAIGGLVAYLATSGTPGDLADVPRVTIIRHAGDALEASFGWGSGTDNDGILELTFIPVQGA